ncbi:hypothetical protein DFH09DRAFT_1151563 [Mycena vulgaris]|nr:hypothetical protein DFH09DRAFT_1151563 [Mycena vulgaris]
MQRKQVHFSQDVLCTPSPSYSMSSLPSSHGPLTPPQGAFNAYLPFAAGGGPTAPHPILAFNAARAPSIFFDVSLPPQNIQLQPPLVLASILGEHATFPGAPSLVLVHPRLPWEIIIRPAEGKYVRVCDVLAGIYSALRKDASGADYAGLPSRAAQNEVNAAFARRWMRMPDMGAKTIEKNKGLKRVDFLGAGLVFCGLIKSQKGPNCWELVLTAAP